MSSAPRRLAGYAIVLALATGGGYAVGTRFPETRDVPAPGDIDAPGHVDEHGTGHDTGHGAPEVTEHGP